MASIPPSIFNEVRSERDLETSPHFGRCNLKSQASTNIATHRLKENNFLNFNSS